MLSVGGRRILDWQLDELRQITDDIVIVGARPLHNFEGLRRVTDGVPESGPSGGLDAAFASARDDRVIVGACDMPFLTGCFLASMLALSDSVDAVLPRTARGYHPLCAVYGRSCHPAVVRRLAERRLKMVELFEDLNVHVVGPAHVAMYGGERLLANVNTPDELDNLQALLGHEL